MARFRTKARRYFRGFKNKARSMNRTSGQIKATDVLIAGVIYGMAKPIIKNTIPDFFSFGPVSSDNLVIGGAGFYGMKKGKGIVKALGIIALGDQASEVSQNLMGGSQTNNSGIYE